MMSNLYLIGELSDNTGLVAGLVAKRFNNVPFFSGYEGLSSQPLSWDLFAFLIRFIEPITVYNFFIVIGFVLAFFFSRKFFKVFFENNNLVSNLLALIFTLSPYMYYRGRGHVDLLQVWLVVYYFYLLLKARKIKHYMILGLLVGVVTAVSNYLGYFSLLLTLTYFIADNIVSVVHKKNIFIRSVLNYFTLLLTFICVTLFFLAPYIKANYFSTNTTSTLSFITTPNGIDIYETSWKIEEDIESVEVVNDRSFKRPIEDFFVFTSRPWYYVLPSPENPIFGGFTTSVIDYLENDWGHWLAKNYFPAEHANSYLGVINILVALIGIYVLFLKKEIVKSRDLTLKILIVFIVINLLMLPPFFTISGIKIYTPSYLLWLIFPMFRVLSRLGILALLNLLVLTGLGLIYIQNVLGNKLSNLMVLVLVTVSLVTFYVPVMITNLSIPPQVYTYIRENTPQNSIIAVYPHSEANQAMFWIREHMRGVINTRHGDHPEFGFNSAKFTKKLNSCVGIKEASNLGVSHIVYFEDKSREATYFDTFSHLVLLKEFDGEVEKDKESSWIKISNKSGTNLGKVKIYKISEAVFEECD